jgi:hypothetical protein
VSNKIIASRTPRPPVYVPPPKYTQKQLYDMRLRCQIIELAFDIAGLPKHSSARGLEEGDDASIAALEAARQALKEVKDPPPSAQERLQAKIDGEVEAILRDPDEVERRRLEAWCDHWANTYTDENYAKFNKMQSCWSSQLGVFENLPDGLVPAGWPDGLTVDSYVRDEVAKWNAPPKAEGDDVDPESDPEEPPAEREPSSIEKMLSEVEKGSHR